MDILKKMKMEAQIMMSTKRLYWEILMGLSIKLIDSLAHKVKLSKWQTASEAQRDLS